MLFLQSGPIPPYNNVPIEPQFYQPSRFVISAINLGRSTLITATVDMNYEIGQNVRLLIPASCGTYQLNNMQGYVTSIPATNQVRISINSQFMDAFINAATGPQNLSSPQIIAIGDISTGARNALGGMNTSITIPGAFINISPL